MAGGGDAKVTGTTGQNIQAILVVVAFAAVGGVLV